MKDNLTNESFWETYWSNLKLPITVDQNFKNDRVITSTIMNSIPKKSDMSAPEIGCAPGKWLGLLSKDLGCNVTGIEYVQVAAEKTIENLKLQNINNFKIITADFFNHPFESTFDIVISLGFIEHFDNFEKVLEDQLKLVSPNGFLIVGIPRFIGINYFFQKCLDRFIKNKLLPSHNLKTMNLEVFEIFGQAHKLKIVCNKFIGGFEPGLFPVAEVSNFTMRVIFKIILRVFNLLFGKIDSYFTSSYQMAIYKK